MIYCREGESGTDEANQRCHLQCLSGIHYNSLTETSLYSPDPHDVPRQPVIQLLNELEEEWEPIAGVQSVYTIEPAGCSCVRGKGKSQAMISLSGLQCCALIDTGAQISLLREDIYQGLQRQGIVPL